MSDGPSPFPPAPADPDRIREYNMLVAEACERLDERLSFIRGDARYRK